jgi:hypothetical protein
MVSAGEVAAKLLDLWHRVAIIMPWFHASLTTTDLPKSGL